jgi:hypothetical protein
VIVILAPVAQVLDEFAKEEILGRPVQLQQENLYPQFEIYPQAGCAGTRASDAPAIGRYAGPRSSGAHQPVLGQ